MVRRQTQIAKGDDNIRQRVHFNLICPSLRVAVLRADGPNMGPEHLRLFQELWVRNHEGGTLGSRASSRRTNRGNEIPRAEQTRRISKISRRRSPDSYLLTKDCGTFRRAA